MQTTSRKKVHNGGECWNQGVFCQLCEALERREATQWKQCERRVYGQAAVVIA